MPSLIKTIQEPGSVKDVDRTRGTVIAYAAAFGNRDADGDIIHKGAFAKTIRERGPEGTGQIKMLYMHRFDEPIGRILQLTEDAHGLLFKAKLILEVPRAKSALALYEADMFEHSVGIDVIQPENFRGGDIHEAKLFDVSPVTWGANDQTPTIEVKSLLANPEQVPNRIRRIRKALSLGIDDETAQDLEAALGVLEAQVRDLIKAITRAKDDPDAEHVANDDAVLSEVLRQIKADSGPYVGPFSPDSPGNSGRFGPDDDDWLNDVLTNLRNANA